MARKMHRNRRGTTHSAIATIFGVGLAVAPLANGNTGAPGGGATPLQLFQQGNWSTGLGALSWNISTNWATYLFALIPVIVVALVAKKFAGKLRLSKHWTV